MTIGSQRFMLAQKLPNKIECRLPGRSDLSEAHATANRSQRLRTHSLSYDLIIHLRLHLILKNGRERTSEHAASSGAFESDHQSPHSEWVLTLMQYLSGRITFIMGAAQDDLKISSESVRIDRLSRQL